MKQNTVFILFAFQYVSLIFSNHDSSLQNCSSLGLFLSCAILAFRKLSSKDQFDINCQERKRKELNLVNKKDVAGCKDGKV